MSEMFISMEECFNKTARNVSQLSVQSGHEEVIIMEQTFELNDIKDEGISHNREVRLGDYDESLPFAENLVLELLEGLQ